VVVSWWRYSTPLWYEQHIEGRRTDISVVDDRTRIDEGLGEFTDVIDRYLGRRPVYAIRVDGRDLATLEARYTLHRLPLRTLQPVSRVTGRLAGQP
jgi:hypothetical protein